MLSLIGISGDDLALAFSIVVGEPLMVVHDSGWVVGVCFNASRCAAFWRHLMGVSFSSSDEVLCTRSFLVVT